MINKFMLTTRLLKTAKQNCPVRDGVKYPGARGGSPFPGNLRLAGIRFEMTQNGAVVTVGGEDAPYAIYTETRSRKPGWQKKTVEDYLGWLQSIGGKLQNG